MLKHYQITAIVVTYNGLRWLDKCLNSLLQSDLPLNIIVIDNASTDSSVKYVEDNYPQIELIKSEKNLGFGKANNIGIRYAMKQNADYVFLLNQDAWIEPDMMKILVDVHKQNEKYGILSPIHLNGEGNRIDSNFFMYTSQNHYSNLWYDYYLGQQKLLYDVSLVNAAAWLVSRECIEKVGCFNPVFEHYGEDDNYCDRVFYHKLKIGVVPSARIYHDRDYDRPNQTDFYTDKQRHLKWSRFIRDAVNINNEPFNLIYKSYWGMLMKDCIKSISHMKIKRAGQDFKLLNHWAKLKRRLRENRNQAKQNNAFL